jgi:hypothetical protein
MTTNIVRMVAIASLTVWLIYIILLKDSVENITIGDQIWWWYIIGLFTTILAVEIVHFCKLRKLGVKL